MKNKILCFGLVLIFLTSMCGCNAEKADILESSDIADCSSSVSNTETSDETDTTVKSEPEKLTETAITTSEPISESNETAPTESKKPVEADKTDIPAAPKAETEKPKPEAPKPPVSEETKEPKKPVQSDKEPPAEQPTEEVKPKTAYDYEFDIEAIRSDLISLGCSMGLTHITTDDGMAITPDNASWATPVTASECFQGERLKRKLTDYVQSMPDIITAYGGAPIEYFTIYIAKQTNVDTNNRLICYDILDLGKQLMPIGMLVVLDSILNRITQNRAKGKNTYIFIDEIYLLFQHEYSANFLFTLWKRVRKYGAYATGITQNVDDLLQSHTARTMLANSEFIIMLNQASTDRLKLAELLNISDLQMSYITNVEAGHGLLKVGSSLVPFANKFPKNTKLYKLMTTKPGESA